MLPNLLNAIYMNIEQINQARTVTYNRRRGPANVVKRNVKFKIKAQIFFVEDEFIEAAKKSPDTRGLSGKIEKTAGYIVVRKVDLEKISKSLKTGDKIVSYGNVGKETASNLFLIGKKDAAHYADRGRPTLEKWFFEDRN